MNKPLGDNLDRIVEIGKSIVQARELQRAQMVEPTPGAEGRPPGAGTASEFDRPMGIGADCLSARKTVKILKRGVTEEDLKHLLSCPACRENVSRLECLNLEPDPEFVAQALKHVETPHERIAAHSLTKASSVLPAILGLESHVFPVVATNANDLILSFALLPGFDRELLSDIDPKSLRLDGAIVAKERSISDVDINRDGKPDYVRVTFADGRLARRVRDGLAHHRRVIDDIRIRGSFQGGRHKGFVGNASLEFSKIGSNLRIALVSPVQHEEPAVVGEALASSP